jgi:predicted acetyltransferase
MTKEKISSERVSLELPRLSLRDSYVESLRDFFAEDPSRQTRWEWLENFDLYLEACRAGREQQGEVDGRMPENVFWITIDQTKAVGKLTLRRQLNSRLERLGGHMGYEIRPAWRRRGIAEEACRLGLLELKKNGLKKVIVTCDEDNSGSRRVLEKNGGRIVESYHLPEWPKPIVKFEFNL